MQKHTIIHSFQLDTLPGSPAMRSARLPRTLAHSEATEVGTNVSVGLNVDMMVARDGRLSSAGIWVAASPSWLGPGGWEAGSGGRGGICVVKGGPASLSLGLGGGAAMELLSRLGAGAEDALGEDGEDGEDGGVRNISVLCGSTGDGGAAVAAGTCPSLSNT